MALAVQYVDVAAIDSAIADLQAFVLTADQPGGYPTLDENGELVAAIIPRKPGRLCWMRSCCRMGRLPRPPTVANRGLAMG